MARISQKIYFSGVKDLGKIPVGTLTTDAPNAGGVGLTYGIFD